MKGQGFRSSVLRCSWAASVDQNWWEKNQRIFVQKAATVEQISSSTTWSVREFLSSSRLVKPSQRNRDLSAAWGLPGFVLRSVWMVCSCLGCLYFSFSVCWLVLWPGSFCLVFSLLVPLVGCLAWLVVMLGSILKVLFPDIVFLFGLWTRIVLVKKKNRNFARPCH